MSTQEKLYVELACIKNEKGNYDCNFELLTTCGVKKFEAEVNNRHVLPLIEKTAIPMIEKLEHVRKCNKCNAGKCSECYASHFI